MINISNYSLDEIDIWNLYEGNVKCLCHIPFIILPVCINNIAANLIVYLIIFFIVANQINYSSKQFYKVLHYRDSKWFFPRSVKRLLDFTSNLENSNNNKCYKAGSCGSGAEYAKSALKSG